MYCPFLFLSFGGGPDNRTTRATINDDPRLSANGVQPTIDKGSRSNSSELAPSLPEPTGVEEETSNLYVEICCFSVYFALCASPLFLRDDFVAFSKMVKVYKCLISGDELVSDSFKMLEVKDAEGNVVRVCDGRCSRV